MRRTLFIGGNRHREWLELDDRLSHVELPAVEAPGGLWSDDAEVSLRLDLYVLRDVMHVVEHPCVRAAGVATIYRIAMWSDLPGDLPLEPIARQAAGGPHVSRRSVGVPRMDSAPDWWAFPLPGGWRDDSGTTPPFVAVL